MSKKVVIVGAGIVGLTLAKELAMHGTDVQVYDAKRDVADGAAKASGIFSISGLGRIGIDPTPALVNRLNGAVLHAGREKLRVKALETKAYVVDRGLLAKSCMESARMAGAEIKLGKRFDREELRALGSDKGNIIIGADGAVSTVASAFAFPKINEYVLTYKAEYRNAFVEDHSMAGLFFANDIAYRFFGWSCPYSKNRIELGLGISDRAKISSTAAYAKFAKSEMVKGIIKNAEMVNGYASIIPLSSRPITVKDNVMLVGDAAGQVKATTGGGIIFGCSCAKVLARIIRANAEKGTPLKAYEREWRKRFSMDLRMHDFLHNYYSNLKVSNMEVFLKISKNLRR